MAKNNVSRTPGVLAQELDQIRNTLKGLPQVLYKLSLATTINYIWKQRNFKIFQHTSESVDAEC